MAKNTVVFTIEDLNKLKINNRKKYLKTILAASFICNRKNVASRQFEKFFIDNGELLLVSCVEQSNEQNKILKNLCVDENTGEVTYETVKSFLENNLNDTKNYDIIIQYESNKKIIKLDSENIIEVYNQITEDPINYLYYEEICYFVTRNINMNQYLINIRMDYIRNELDIIGCILFLEKSKNHEKMKNVVLNFISYNEDDVMRLKTLLNIVCKRYKLLINDEHFTGAELPYVKLSPLYIFTQNQTNDVNAFQYKSFSDPIKNYIVSEDVFKELIKYEAERIWYIKLFKKLPKELYRNDFIAKNIDIQLFNNFEKTIASQIWRNFLNCLECRETELKKRLDSVFYNIKTEGEKEKFKSQTIEKIVYILSNDIIISNIMDVVIEFIQKSSPNFSCVLMFQFLVAFLKEDEALGSDLDEDEIKSILRRIYLNICSFSEGIFQLIENTCLHSDSHCGFLSTKIHSTSLLQYSSMNDLIKNAQNVDKLKLKYKTNPENAKDSLGAKYHLEIRINDISNYGIVDTYMQQHSDVFDSDSNLFLRDFFEDNNNIIDAINPDDRERKDIVINHYGLRLLNRIIKVNNGDFSVTSVGKSLDDVYSLSENYNIEKQTYGTEYSILFPMSLQSYESFTDATVDSFEEKQLFSTQINIDSLLSVVPNHIAHLTEKTEKISEIYKNISNKLKGQATDNSYEHLENQIVCIDFKDYNISEVELAAKALIRIIADIHFSLQGQKKTHVANFALLFGENCELKIYEFVRIFSVFYTKSGVCDKNSSDNKLKNDGINEWMRGVQIALCSSDNYIGNEKFDGVNFVIAGSNIESARLSALSYTYYNSNLALKYISAVRYFTRIASTNEKPKRTVNPALIPFDLFLSGSGKNEDKLCINKYNSWFIKQIQSVVETPIQNTEYGCKNEDIHIKIGSKIHISDFYEAELLFHNISNIEKFAFLLASEILNKQTDQKRNIVLIGYESYSESLILKIKDRLAMHPDINKVSYSIYYKEPAEHGHEETLTNLENIDDLLADNADCILVMPIGTTLSTVHKIKNVLIRKCRGNISEKINLQWQHNKHFVILEIRDLSQKNDKGLSIQEAKYWENISGNVITLSNETKETTQQDINVQYLIQASTNWQDASSCKYCLLDDAKEYAPEDYINAQILVDVDKTSTIPCSIFRLKKNNKSGYDFFIGQEKGAMISNEKNNARLNQLEDCIIYSHIYLNHNHFQYYFDAQKYYQKVKEHLNKQINVVEWLQNVKEQLSPRIDNTFNIIVSPLKRTNSQFLNDVERYVFNHNIRFLHFPPEDSFREEIRAKFSYIAEEYKRIKRMNRNNKVNIFYVDDAITTGKTFQRARNYIRMLLNESDVFDNTQKIFDGVIILLNRNSYDTVCNYVSNPKEDFFAFVHIAISAIKASNGYCPSCKTAEQFLLLKKRSSENDMRMEFDRLLNKQKKRTVEGYKKWLDREIENRHGYFSWLKQWIYTYGNQINDREEKDKIDKAKNFIKNLYQSILGNQNIDIDQSLEFWNSLSLRKLKYIFSSDKIADITDDLFSFEKRQNKQIKNLKSANINMDFSEEFEICKELIKKYAVPHRDYMRTICTHKINLATEVIFKELDSSSTRETINDKTVKVFLEMFNNDCGYYGNISSFKKCQDIISADANNDIITNAQKIDLLISYIKTSSRPLPARYHNIEQAIFKIITAFSVAMLKTPSEIETEIERIAQKVILQNDEQGEKYRIMFINIAKTFIDFKNVGIDANISPAHQLELFKVMMNRLGIMQSNFVTNKTVIERIFSDDGILQETRNEHQKLAAENEEYGFLCEFPEDEWIIFAYRRMIMRLSMLSDNDSINIALDRNLLKSVDEED